MRRGSCLALLVGIVVGSLLLGLLVWWIRPVTPLVPVQPEIANPDITLFLSEQTASRFASQALREPTMIQFDSGGQIVVTTRVAVGGQKPLVDLGLTLERVGPAVSTQLHWLQIGWIRVPARWLPSDLVALGAVPGQAITRQLPPQATLVGLTTSSDGITLRLNWAGQ
jgi:hypothetical protein